MRRKRFWRPHQNIIPSPSYDFFKITHCLKLQIAITESCCYLISWENYRTKSSGTSFIASLSECLQIWFGDWRNFTFNRFYGLKTGQKWWLHWIFGHFCPITLINFLNLKIRIQILCRYPPKKAINQVSELLVVRFSRDLRVLRIL